MGTLGNDPFAETLAAQGQEVGLNLRFAARVRANTALSVIHSADIPDGLTEKMRTRPQ